MSKDFLVEIGTEELPPKSLKTLADAFEASICKQLKELGLNFSASKQFAAPRRLSVLISDLDEKQADKEIENLGPAVKAAFDDGGNPTPAAQGFARKQGIDVSELTQVDTDKGPRLAFSKTEQGAETENLLEGVINKALSDLPIAKRMRWGSRREEFVRPVHWILMLFGTKTVPATVLGLEAGNSTRGHRFYANSEMVISEPASYADVLRDQGKVIADFEVRKALVKQSVMDAAAKTKGTAVIDEDLLDEVTSLVEWPVALAGRFDNEFLQVPSEALISSMKEHQKYFHVVDDDGSLLPFFITVSNIESQNEAAVIEGNERVIRPRLADAAFFYQTDLKTPFADFRERLKPIVFQTKLGNVFEKTERVASLAKNIAPIVGADVDAAHHAGTLCKNDLVTEMVGEFSDLQGLMGRYYAQAANESTDVATAMEEHYFPKFAGDSLPSNEVATAVALADRLDTLTGIFGIGQIPSGSKDPFALRRASLGVLRLLVENKHHCSLSDLLKQAHSQHSDLSEESTSKLLHYMLDRFSAWFADLGIPAESFIAVRALDLDNPTDIYSRTMAVTEFAKTADAPTLAAANKRVSNILSKSEISDSAGINIDQTLFAEQQEKNLFDALSSAETAVEPLIAKQDYSSALKRLAVLREPIDQFFDSVMVMADDEALKQNRLSLLAMLRRLFLTIADISLLPNEG